MLAQFRLGWQMQRWELVMLIGACLLVSAVAILVAWQLKATEADLLACYQSAPDSTVPDWPCRSSVDWGNLLLVPGPIVVWAASVAPFFVGVFFGAPLVAREVEKRTAPSSARVDRNEQELAPRRT